MNNPYFSSESYKENVILTDSEIELIYENTFFDVLYFYIYFCFRKALMHIVFGLYSLLVVFPVFNKRDNTGVGFYYSVILGGVACIVIYVFLWLLTVLLSLLYLWMINNKGFLTEHKIKVTREGLGNQTKYSQSLFFWNGIKKVHNTKRLIVVYTNINRAILIPTKVFSSQAQAEEFVSIVEAHMKNM